MNTVILTLAVTLFITGVSSDCPVKAAIEIYQPGSETSNCKLDAQTIVNNTKVMTSCNVECECGKDGLKCCLQQKCTLVDGDCEIMEINTDGTIGCALY